MQIKVLPEENYNKEFSKYEQTFLHHSENIYTILYINLHVRNEIYFPVHINE